MEQESQAKNGNEMFFEAYRGKGRRPISPRSSHFICEEFFWRESQPFYFTWLPIEGFLIRQSIMYMIPATSGGRAKVKITDASAFP